MLLMNNYFNRYFVTKKNYPHLLPPDLKKLILTEIDLVSCSALSLTNKNWNFYFKEIFSQNPQVKAIQAHVKKIEYKPDCIERLILQNPTIQSINFLAKWIITNDILCVRNLMAAEVLKAIIYLIDEGFLDEDRLQETKNMLNGARNDPDFVTELAVNPSSLKEITEYFSLAQQLKDDSNLKDYIKMTSDYIENFDTGNLKLATIPEDLVLLTNLNTLKINGIELSCKNEKLDLTKIRVTLSNKLLNLDFEPYHFKK